MTEAVTYDDEWLEALSWWKRKPTISYLDLETLLKDLLSFYSDFVRKLPLNTAEMAMFSETVYLQ